MANQLFTYEGRDTNGKSVSGKLEASRIDEIVLHLKRQNITPIDIKPVKKNAAAQILSSPTFRIRKIEPYHIMNFCRQLALLNDTGIPLIKAIRKLSESSTSKSLRVILNDVANSIAAGMTLSNSLKKHPIAFSPIIVNIVEIGENTGKLSEVLIYLSQYIEASINNKRRLISAIRYPTFVFLTAVLSIIILSYVIIPKFAVMFYRFDFELPLPTRIIIACSNFMVDYRYYILFTIALIVVGTNRLLKIPAVCYWWDKHKLRMPIFGPLQRRILISQFTWTFSLILRAGVPIIKGLGLASHSADNLYFQNKIAKMGEDIEHGENLSRSAIASGLFTPITIQMIEVGEESEKLDETLSELSKYYDSEIDYDLKRLNEIIEPVLIGIVGFMILVMVLGIYFPMWELIKVAQA